MSDDYLWDRSGPPDPEVEHLERVLGTLRHVDRGEDNRGGGDPSEGDGGRGDRGEGDGGGGDRGEGAPGDAPAAPVPITSARRARAGAWVRRTFLLAAAAIALGVGAWVVRGPAERPLLARPLAIDPGPAPPADPAWRVERIAGLPTSGAAPVRTTGELGVGEWLETDGVSSARLEVPVVGHVEVGASSRVRLSATGPGLHRLDLERGAISARVNAPPRLFVVGTPAATAVDLGCAYTLAVDEAGAATLSVSSGWVSLEDRGRASLVPAGASCRTRPGAGPGTPSFDDAPAALREALARFDFDAGGPAAVRVVLQAARRRDSLTVWHLLSRVDEGTRRAVYARLRELDPPPTGVGEPDVLRLDPPALYRWREQIVVTW